MPAPDPQDVLARLRASGRDLLALISNASPGALRREPAPDEWSPAVVVGHLADAELNYSVRIRTVVTGDRPFLPAYDQDAWAERFGELEEDARSAYQRWRVLRDTNVRLLEDLDPDEWRLTGMHAERGEVSVLQLAAALADHDRAHLDQIRRALAAT